MPKPHTPFEAEPFAGEASLRRRQELLRAALPRGVKASFHDVGRPSSRRISPAAAAGSGALVESAWRVGARFDGWTEHFDPRVGASRRGGLGVQFGEPAMADAGEAPWRLAVDPAVDAGFLAGERARAMEGMLTDDCRGGRCSCLRRLRR